MPAPTDHDDASDVFGTAVNALGEAEFRARFLNRNPARYAPLPEPTAAQLRNARLVVDGIFDLVGETYRLPAGFSWQDNPSRDTEWQIAQHKFYFALDLAQAYRVSGDAVYLRRWIELIDSWLGTMGSGFITASDAQVEAKRIEHWVMSLLALQGTRAGKVVSGEFLRRFLARIAHEALYVAGHLRPSRNHRTFQLYSMFLVGVLFPEFACSAMLCKSACEALTANLLNDFGSDGVHIELSTHYHQITLETALTFVELARLNLVPVDKELLQRLHRALEFSLFVTWPDGEIPLINDSDNGDHLPLLRRGARLTGDRRLAWAGTLGQDGEPPRECSQHFDAAGYFVFSDGWGVDTDSYRQRQHVFFDCGKLGEGSHSQYDLFSFCYYLSGRQIVVDPGRYTYRADADDGGIDWRREFKSTRYHNTVGIDGLDQTRYLSKATNPPAGVERYDRTRHHAKHGPEIELADQRFHLGQRTDWVWGVARSREYSPEHCRLFVYMDRSYLAIFDFVRIDDGREHQCTLRLHLAAECLGEVQWSAVAGACRARGDGWGIWGWGDGDSRPALETGWVSKAYGQKRQAPVVAVATRSAVSIGYRTVIAPTSPSLAGTSVSNAVSLEPDALAVSGLRVDVIAGSSNCQDVFVFQPATRRLFEDDCVSFVGRFLVYRRDAAGKVIYLCADRPDRLEIRHGGGQLAGAGQEVVEWTATTTRSTSLPS